MGLYLVTERLTEINDYYHLVEAESEEEARAKVDAGESSVVGAEFVRWGSKGKIVSVERVDGYAGTIASKIAPVADTLCQLCPQCRQGECRALQASHPGSEEGRWDDRLLCQLV